MTSSLLASSLSSGVVGSGDGDGGTDAPPALKEKHSVGASDGAGLGVRKPGSAERGGCGGQQLLGTGRAACFPRGLGSPGEGTGLWLLRTGLSERRLRDALSSLPMSLLRSGCCLRSNEPEEGEGCSVGRSASLQAHKRPHTSARGLPNSLVLPTGSRERPPAPLLRDRPHSGIEPQMQKQQLLPDHRGPQSNLASGRGLRSQSPRGPGTQALLLRNAPGRAPRRGLQAHRA